MAAKCFYDVSKLKDNDTSEYPDFVSWFYDSIFPDTKSLNDGYYLDLISRTNGSILEIGAGTGRIFAEALKKGADIYGIDASRHMIDVLRTKITDSEQGRVFCKNAGKMNLGLKFDLIIAPFRVFQHFLDFDSQIELLNNVYNHLNKDGKFVFDVFIPDLNMLLHPENYKTESEFEYKSGKYLHFSARSEYILHLQRLKGVFVYKWTDNEKSFNREWNFEVRYFFRYELENLIRLSPLKLKGVYGDLPGKEIDVSSSNFVVVCEK